MYHAARWVPDLLDFDESRALAVKAIWAHGGVPGDEERQALRELADAEDAIVREAAQAQLDSREMS